MAVPVNREEFKEYCLRSLGKPLINIDVHDDQVEDRIDEALSYYYDYHFDGSEMVYYKHQITDQNKVDKYITLPENIIGAVRIFPIADPSIGSDDLFNIRYQIALNDLYTLTSTSLVPYYMAMEHLSLITQLLVGEQPIRYSRHKDRLYIDMDWNTLNTGDFLLVEAYEVIDPNTYTDVWKDRWLYRYCAQLIKQTWGSNLKKFSGTPLPGGVTLNGQVIYDEATAAIEELEEKMANDYSMPPRFFVG